MQIRSYMYLNPTKPESVRLAVANRVGYMIKTKKKAAAACSRVS